MQKTTHQYDNIVAHHVIASTDVIELKTIQNTKMINI